MLYIILFIIFAFFLLALKILKGIIKLFFIIVIIIIAIAVFSSRDHAFVSTTVITRPDTGDVPTPIPHKPLPDKDNPAFNPDKPPQNL